MQPVYGGAAARPFKTHINDLDMDIFLGVSPELYLKRLLVGGLEKIYEIGKCFRNEGIDKFHNPDFTMIEFYWAYADYKQLMKMTEKMFDVILTKVLGTTDIKYGENVLNFNYNLEQELQKIKEELGLKTTNLVHIKPLKFTNRSGVLFRRLPTEIELFIILCVILSALFLKRYLFRIPTPIGKVSEPTKL